MVLFEDLDDEEKRILLEMKVKLLDAENKRLREALEVAKEFMRLNCVNWDETQKVLKELNVSEGKK